jgi:hypothetical protein
MHVTGCVFHLPFARPLRSPVPDIFETAFERKFINHEFTDYTDEI